MFPENITQYIWTKKVKTKLPTFAGGSIIRIFNNQSYNLL